MNMVTYDILAEVFRFICHDRDLSPLSVKFNRITRAQFGNLPRIRSDPDIVVLGPCDKLPYDKGLYVV